jgi:hypothetical protein
MIVPILPPSRFPFCFELFGCHMSVMSLCDGGFRCRQRDTGPGLKQYVIAYTFFIQSGINFCPTSCVLLYVTVAYDGSDVPRP